MSIQSTTLCRPTASSSAPTLRVWQDDFDDIIRYSQAAAPSEVCGFAFVRKNGNSAFTLIPGSVFITQQYAAPGASQPTAIGESSAMDAEEDFGDEEVYRLLWHSHVNGTPSFSSTDLQTHDNIEFTSGHNLMFFMVVNVCGQATANYEQYTPVRVGTQLELIVIKDVENVDMTPYTQAVKKMSIPFPKPTKPVTHQTYGVVFANDDDPDPPQGLFALGEW